MAIHLGILGLAHGHVGVYCDQWQKTPAAGIKLVSAWDHDAVRANAAKEKYGIELAASPAALLGSKVDAVIIGAETSMHADLVEQAAAAGKTIILQKPMALTLGRGGSHGRGG